MHRISVAGFPKYLIFYQAREGEILILRVVHGARDLESLFSEGGSPKSYLHKGSRVGANQRSEIRLSGRASFHLCVPAKIRSKAFRDIWLHFCLFTAHHKLPVIGQLLRGAGRQSRAVHFPILPTPADVHRPSRRPDP